MSMFSFPTEMNMSEMMKPINPMADWTKTEDLAVSPLMVYPLGAAAAATAVGFGIAGQMAGLMMGAVQGALQSQSALMGAHPDLSWMMPGLAEDLAPDEDAATTVADVKPAARTKQADVVELKPVAKSAPAAAKPAPVKAKVTAAKAVKAKPAPAKAKAVKIDAPVAVAKDAAAEVVEQLKSDADVVVAMAKEPASVSKVAQQQPATVLAPEDFRRPSEMEKPETPDDLKVISGVGPKLEQVLNGLGIWTYAQIAGWQPEEVAWVEDYLQFKGRIGRDDWLSQAGALATGGAPAE
ncbi:hypothetical protein IMCC20628_01656 [Hoeflea sp. IMCC20628]|uniref:hypothetical protein n=1 Tax=Hoeflea sp. IMCC20628 TaxID=1620421 RepID=UPI00063BEB6B|nr:hypothetical protein [Hoeflea sp. IMCC20628]AKI00370.1 hypothetical protein IMCC20628_01656 [Hoeflea sp. IMCC20628]